MYGGFGRRFGNPWSEGDWEGWTPPWMQGEGYGPRGPRGPFGPGRGFFGPRGPFGPGPRFFGPRGPFGPGWQGRQQWGPWGSPELQALMSEAAEVARLFAIASRGALENRERLAQLRALLERSRKELSDMIYGTGQTGSTGNAPDVGQA